MTRAPNVLYLHSHDTGRYVEPYGHPIATPNIQQLANQGIVFREAFCAVPTCSGSRACLLTGQYGHSNGMLGLAHRGWELRDYREHIVHTLRRAGYWSALTGEQHLSIDPDRLGYDRVVKLESTHVASVAPSAIELLASRPPEPWFLSVGFFETHREFFAPSSVGDVLYSRPPANLPDDPATRRDMASYKASAKSLDQGVGAVLAALDVNELVDDTLVLFTTDHGIAFPGAKATLYDRGLGVALIVRGPGGFEGGRVIDALVSHLDVYPTLCDLAGIEHPPFVQGRSLLPLAHREAAEIRDEIFAEATFHAAYEPQRCVRTPRYKYIRRYGDRATPVLPNTDDGPSKDLLLSLGWAGRRIPFEQLYDLAFDPNEAANLADDPEYADLRRDLSERLDRWMRETGDPLLDGPVRPPSGARVNLPDQVSPSEPTVTAG
jgi:N-sulfoglucosamine sulfohydrolase